MLVFPVSQEKILKLESRLKKLNINEDDIIENFIKGTGSGGQKINKTSSCVQIIHKNSGTEIKCQKTRSQSLNRYYARIILCDQLEEKIEGFKTKKKQEEEKLKRQKRKRHKRAKEKILKEKKHTAKKKATRRTVEE
jgi:protein subunit release factor B